jgi:histidine ammonia-lyase
MRLVGRDVGVGARALTGDQMVEATPMSADSEQASASADDFAPQHLRRHDRMRRLVVELAGIDLLSGNGARSLRRRRAGRDRTLVQYALLAARSAA